MVALLADIPTTAPVFDPVPRRRTLQAVPAARPAAAAPRRSSAVRLVAIEGALVPRAAVRPAAAPMDVRRLAPRPSPRPAPTVYRRRRVVALLLAGLVALTAVFALKAALGRTGGGPLTITGATGGLQPAAARVWVVRPGDTLWAIAEAVDPHGDVRPLVDRLSAEVHGAALYPGEPIPIPASIR